MDRRNTLPAPASNGMPPPHRRGPAWSGAAAHQLQTPLPYINMTRIRALHACSTTIDAGATDLPRALVEEVVDLARGLGADPGHLGEIGQRRALDRLERTEMVEQRAFAGRADAGDFLQPRLADIPAAPEAGRADGGTVRLAAQPLDGIKSRISQLERELLPPAPPR